MRYHVATDTGRPSEVTVAITAGLGLRRKVSAASGNGALDTGSVAPLTASIFPGPSQTATVREDGRGPITRPLNRTAAPASNKRPLPHHFHDLRHSYATAALRAGVNTKVVSDRIGHANVGFFLETYAHVLKKDDREAAEQAASFLLGPDLYPAPDGVHEK